MIIVINERRLIEISMSPLYSSGQIRKNMFQITVGDRISKKCLICQGDIKDGGEFVVCPYCLNIYHLSCVEDVIHHNKLNSREFKCLYCGNNIPLDFVEKFDKVSN